MGANRGAVKDLHEVRRRAEVCKRLKGRPEHTAAAQLGDRFQTAPVAVLRWKRSPSHVLDGEEMRRLKEAAIVEALIATPRETTTKYFDRDFPLGFGHSCQRRSGSALPTCFESPTGANWNPTPGIRPPA